MLKNCVYLPYIKPKLIENVIFLCRIRPTIGLLYLETIELDTFWIIWENWDNQKVSYFDFIFFYLQWCTVIDSSGNLVYFLTIRLFAYFT